jgi:very-short-patch-repair endonuclease
MNDIVFLKALRDKLKGGNTKSIYLNVLPGRYAQRLDISNLNLIRQDFAGQFLQQLFTNSVFEFKISFDGLNLNSLSSDDQKRLGLLSKRLNTLNFDNDDNFKEHGIKTFGFGFPILVKPSKQDPRKIIKAPIFIWNLEIVKSTNKVNTWSILRNKVRNENGRIIEVDAHSIRLNEVLLSYLKVDEDISYPQIGDELLDDNLISSTELVDECFKLLQTFNSKSPNNSKEALESQLKKPLGSIPESSVLESMSGNIPYIHFGGVFGIFRTPKESIIADIDRISENIEDFQFENLKVEKVNGTVHSAVETDPSQQEILASLGIEPKKIIQGPPGTGKSQSLTAIITNALANDLKCLVVCEKKTALDVIKNNLNNQSDHLGSLVAIIEDINKDRDSIVNSVRDRLSNLNGLINFNQNTYKTILDDLDSKVNNLNFQHKLLEKKVYCGKTWTELVGLFLKSQKESDFELLISRIDFKKFEFLTNENELLEIMQSIKSAKGLFIASEDSENYLEWLNESIYNDDNPYSIQLSLERILNESLKQLGELKENLNKDFNDYTNWLKSHYEDFYLNIRSEIAKFKDLMSSYQTEFGDFFYVNDRLTKYEILFRGLFIGRYKKLSNTRLILFNQLKEIKRLHQRYNYFEHNFEFLNQNINFKNYELNINLLTENLDVWFSKVEKFPDLIPRSFSSCTVRPDFIFKEQIIQNEVNFDKIFFHVHNEIIRKSSFSVASDHNQRLIEIEQLHFVLNCLLKNLKYFRQYFDWRKFFNELSDLHQYVIKELIDSRSKNWEKSFDSWYLFWLISFVEKELKGLPNSDNDISDLLHIKNQLKKVQIRSILNRWSLKQYYSLERANKQGLSPVALFNKRGSRGERRNSLRKIISTDFNFFTDFFPVVMLNPSVCSSLIPLKEGIFDLVIFDEASQLRLEDTFPSLIRGKIKVVSGDSQQMPPMNYFQGGTVLINPSDEFSDDEDLVLDDQSNNSTQAINESLDLADSESLLSYAENRGYKQSYLKVHYRSQHPDLIEFSNHAFYGKRLIPMPARFEYTPIEFIDVKGRYEDQVNREEATKVIDILTNDIKLSVNGSYPSVGIATFNLYQRNLILDEISKKRQDNPDFDKKIGEMGSDFFVKNLENIQGDERDIMIISTTFGRRTDSSFRQMFGPILQRNGYRLLNVIITRAKTKVFVCTSIPSEHISSYPTLLQEMKNNGRAVFYAYLAYSRAVSLNDKETKDSILNLLYENSESKSFDIECDALGSESPFEDEVYYRLAEKVGQDRLQQQHRVGGFRIDIVIKSKITGKPLIALECDGAKYHSSNEAYSWDIFRQTRLEEHGFIFYRIWSTNWWRSSDNELVKLLDFVNKIDNDERHKFMN